VHDTRGIADVSVAAPVAIAMLRGAYRSGRGAPAPWSLAWGQLPPGADRVEVVFRSGSSVERASAVSVAGRFWVAEVPGRYRAVTVSAGLKRATARLLTRAGGNAAALGEEGRGLIRSSYDAPSYPSTSLASLAAPR
jgi:hypothetical protein